MVWISALILIASILIAIFGQPATGAAPSSRPASGPLLLLALAVIGLAYVVILLVHYWEKISANSDLAFLGAGLAISMLAGMIVSVLAGNARARRPLFRVSVSQLVLPMLFGPVVFYPIWTLNNGANGSTLFLVYAAFVNGYCWERIVGDIRPVKGKG